MDRTQSYNLRNLRTHSVPQVVGLLHPKLQSGWTRHTGTVYEVEGRGVKGGNLSYPLPIDMGFGTVLVFPVPKPILTPNTSVSDESELRAETEND